MDIFSQNEEPQGL